MGKVAKIFTNPKVKLLMSNYKPKDVLYVLVMCDICDVFKEYIVINRQNK